MKKERFLSGYRSFLIYYLAVVPTREVSSDPTRGVSISKLVARDNDFGNRFVVPTDGS